MKRLLPVTRLQSNRNSAEKCLGPRLRLELETTSKDTLQGQCLWLVWPLSIRKTILAFTIGTKIFSFITAPINTNRYRRDEQSRASPTLDTKTPTLRCVASQDTTFLTVG